MIRRLNELCQNQSNFDRIEKYFNKTRLNEGNKDLRDIFLKELDSGIQKLGLNYISVIKGLKNTGATLGTKWLQGIVDNISATMLNVLLKKMKNI